MRLFGAFAILLALFVAFSAAPEANAADGSVHLVPQVSLVPKGTTTSIDLVIDPPAVGTAIWIERVDFDPSVAEYVGCTTPPDPGIPNTAYAASCDIAPAGDFVAFGGYIENQGGVPYGFESTRIVATVTFRAIGPVGSQTVLDVTTQSMLGPNGEDLHPQDVDGLFIVTAPFNPVGGTVEMLSSPGDGPSSWTIVVEIALVTAVAATAFVHRRVRR